MSTTKRQTEPIEWVRTGMTVVDANGEWIGPVGHVQAGDPEAVASQDEGPERPRPAALGAALADGFDEPDVPEP